MRLRRAQLGLTVLLIGALAAGAAELKLSLVSRSRSGGDMMLRAEFVPDRPRLRAADFVLTLDPVNAAAAPRAVRLPAIIKRLRGAYYLDVRKLPPLPHGQYVLALGVGGTGVRVIGAELPEKIEVTPPELDVALVIDQSFSMRRTDPERLRVAAAKVFVDLAASGRRIRSICVIGFDRWSYTLLPLTTPSDKARCHRAIDRVDSLGQTNMDAALQRAHQELRKGKSPGKAVVLLSDGKNDPIDYNNTHRTFAKLKWPVYTIGLSKEADARTLALIARQTGGRYYPAPTNQELHDIFSRICFALDRQTTVTRRTLALEPGRLRREPIPIDDTISRVMFSTRSEQKDLAFRVAPPAGTRKPDHTGSKETLRFFSYRKPGPGAWTAELQSAAAVDAELQVMAATTLFPVLFPLPHDHPFGTPLEIACSLADEARPLARATVDARIRTPDGKTITLRLADQGDGIYAGTITQEIKPGQFTLSLVARGATAKGRRFERQLLANGTVAPPRAPQIWTAATALQLGSLYNGETGAATVELRRILPPGVDLQLATTCQSAGLPADAFKVVFGKADANRTQKLELTVAVPAAQRAGSYRPTLVVSLGPNTTRKIPVELQVLNPRLVARPGAVDLGTALGGTRVERTVQLRAEPRGSLDVKLAFEGDIAARLEPLRAPTVRVGQKPVTVSVASATAPDAESRAYSGALALAGHFERKSVPVRLVVGETTLASPPTALDFGELKPGQSASRTLTLRASGPAAVTARAKADFAGALPAGSVDTHGRSVTLDPRRPTPLNITLTVPPGHPPGLLTGSLRFTTHRQVGRIGLRVKVAPIASFAAEPGEVHFGPAPIGCTSRARFILRSLIDRDQQVRVEPAGGSDLIAAGPGTVHLPARGTATVTLSCLPPIDSPQGTVRRAFRLAGPMLPATVTADADLQRPDDFGFRLAADTVRLDADPGQDLNGGITVHSTLDVPQRVALLPDAAPRHSAWLSAPRGKTALAARGTAAFGFRCCVYPGATEGRHQQQVVVRGPLGERTVRVNIGVRAPEQTGSRASRYLAAAALLLASILTAALVYLIVRALLRIPGHRMLKYLAASAVLNLGFFLLLTEMLAVKRVMEEKAIVVRLDEGIDIPAVSAPQDSPTNKAIKIKERELQAKAQRRKAELARRKKESSQAKQEELEARRRTEERERTKVSNTIEEKPLDLSKLSNKQLEELVSSAEAVKRKLERETGRQVRPKVVDEPRVVMESKENRTLQAAVRLAQAARDLQARRTQSRLPEQAVTAPADRAARFSIAAVEDMLDEAQEAARKAEAATTVEARAAQPGAARQSAPAGGTRGSASAGQPSAGDARRATAAKVAARPRTGATRLADTGQSARLAAKLEQALGGEARTNQQKYVASGRLLAGETQLPAARAAAPAAGARGVNAPTGAGAPGVAAQEIAARRSAAPNAGVGPGVQASTVQVDRPAAPSAALSAEARNVTHKTAASRALGAAESDAGTGHAAAPASDARDAVRGDGSQAPTVAPADLAEPRARTAEPGTGAGVATLSIQAPRPTRPAETVTTEARSARPKVADPGAERAAEAGAESARASAGVTGTKSVGTGGALPADKARQTAAARSGLAAPATGSIALRPLSSDRPLAPTSDVPAEARRVADTAHASPASEYPEIASIAGSVRPEDPDRAAPRSSVQAAAASPIGPASTKVAKPAACVAPELGPTGSRTRRQVTRSTQPQLAAVGGIATRTEPGRRTSVPETRLAAARSTIGPAGAGDREGVRTAAPGIAPSRTRAAKASRSGGLRQQAIGGPTAERLLALGPRERLDAETRAVGRKRSDTGTADAAPAAAGSGRVSLTSGRARSAVNAPGQPSAARPTGIRSDKQVGGRTGPAGLAPGSATVQRVALAPAADRPTTTVRTVKAHRIATGTRTVGAQLVGASRSGMVAGQDRQTGVLAAPSPEVAPRAAGAGRLMPGEAPPSGVAQSGQPGPERLAQARAEPVATEAVSLRPRTGTSSAPRLAETAEPTQRPGGPQGAGTKWPTHFASTGPLVRPAGTGPTERHLDPSFEGGMLLAMAAPAGGRTYVAVDIEQPDVTPQAPARHQTLPDTGSERLRPVEAGRLELRPAGDRQVPPARADLTPARLEPLRTRPAQASRLPVGTVAFRPTGPTVPRAVGLSLAGQRAGGSVGFALARYSGDWDCDATAMPNLAYQLERRVGILLSTEARTVQVTDPALLKQPFLFISGHKAFRFTDAELAALQRYIRAGGSIWINDSTHEMDETFDKAVRSELKRLLPGQPLAKLPQNHGVFRSCYDLTRGFKGYKVPPGDKYRCDYLEGVDVNGRTAVVYTRNDYGDGLEINPNTAPLMPSLTDLSPHDMQEGSVRMGINIALHFLRGRRGGEAVDAIARAVRDNTAREERDRRTAVAEARMSVLDNFDTEFSWVLEKDWGDDAQVAPVARTVSGRKDVRLGIRFALGAQKKVAAGRDLLEEKDLSKHDALVIDFNSKLTAGCRVAVGLVTMPDWKYVESSPVYLRPGDNPNVVFRLDQPTFKSADSGWKFNQRAKLSALRKIVLLIYPLRAGVVEVDNVRLATFKTGR